MVLLFRDSDGAPNMSFAMPGVPPITTETILVNLTFMLFGEMIMSDALVVILSRTDYVSDTKVDLPSAWRERAHDAYLALYACLALLTVFGVTQCVVEMCYTSLGDFGDGNDFGDYTISLCPVLEAHTRAGIREKYGLFPNISSVQSWDRSEGPLCY